jgi:multidrug transporter EmrE-like cation transporter
LEDTPRAFDDINANKMILVWSILICFSIASFNAFGVAVTKNASSAQRSTIDTSRTVIIWVVQLILGEEKFKVLQLFGFILLVFGTLVYNEILVVPFFGFDQNTKAARARREKEEGMLDSNRNTTTDGANYQAVSPHAAYDATRNKRKVQEKLDEMQRAKYEGGLNKSELTLDENYEIVKTSTTVLLKTDD